MPHHFRLCTAFVAPDIEKTTDHTGMPCIFILNNHWNINPRLPIAMEIVVTALKALKDFSLDLLNVQFCHQMKAANCGTIPCTEIGEIKLPLHNHFLS